MRSQRGDEPETYHLTCPVCGALPGTSRIEDFQELERVHPSRKMSVAELNRRHAAIGWEPTELAERRPGIYDAASVQALEAAAGLGSPVRRPQAAVPAPRREPENAASPGWADAARAAAGFSRPAPGSDSRIWFAVYLSAFPRGAAVPRRQLRSIANVRDGHDHPLRRSPAKQAERSMNGRGSSSKGRRSSQRLAGHLKSFEDLGLIRRSSTMDAVIVADPAGLRRLADSPPEQPGGPGADGS